MTAELVQGPAARHKAGTSTPAPSPTTGTTRGTAGISLFSVGRQVFRGQVEDWNIFKTALNYSGLAQN